MRLISAFIFCMLLSLQCGYAIDYSQDANCQQLFDLDDGTADSSDRAGSNNLTLANGTWAGSNDGYIFDADATGTFTPTLREWQGTDTCFMVLTTVQNASGKIIFITYQASDSERRMQLGSSIYSNYTRPRARFGRNYSISEFNLQAETTGGAKQWITCQYDTSDTSAEMFVDGTSRATDTVGSESGTNAMDTGLIGKGSTHTIYQVGVFDRLLSSVEISDIVANGFGVGAPPAGGWTHTINGVTAANMASVNTVLKANIAEINQT